MKPSSLTVVILTLNEERNLTQALDSVCGWADQVYVLDSFSTDRTPEIARARGCHFQQRRFVDYATQRNHALDTLPEPTEWVLFLDADELVPQALREEISNVLSAHPIENGFSMRYRLMWRGKWIRRGYHSVWLLRLFRVAHARCELRAVNEHMRVEGPVGRLANDLVHEDRKPLEDWLRKHLRYAQQEAALASSEPGAGGSVLSLLGARSERVRWLRANVWNRMPLLVRPWIYFGVRYIAQGGILDGREALAFHTLQALWLQTIIDLQILERAEDAHTEHEPTPGVTDAPCARRP